MFCALYIDTYQKPITSECNILKMISIGQTPEFMLDESNGPHTRIILCKQVQYRIPGRVIATSTQAYPLSPGLVELEFNFMLHVLTHLCHQII